MNIYGLHAPGSVGCSFGALSGACRLRFGACTMSVMHASMPRWVLARPSVSTGFTSGGNAYVAIAAWPYEGVDWVKMLMGSGEAVADASLEWGRTVSTFWGTDVAAVVFKSASAAAAFAAALSDGSASFWMDGPVPVADWGL